MTAGLTDHEWQVLHNLWDYYAGHERWVRPLDLGGPSSRTHYALMRLIKKGYVERKPRLGGNSRSAHQRTPYVYRLKEEFWASKPLPLR